MAAWLPQPVAFDSSHSFDCEGFTNEQCRYYKEHWHNWYIADWAFALPTVAFFMSTIGFFILGYAVSRQTPTSVWRDYAPWRRGLAATRVLSYRGVYISSLNWNSAPVGVLLLGGVGTIFFFCMDLVPSPYYWPGSDTVWGNSPPLGTRSGWLALACMPFLFATATKANWITLVTGVSHEKLQVFHRWIAYAFFVLALMHTFPFIVWHIQNHDMVEQFNESNTFEYWTGIVALLLQAWLTVASWGPVRQLAYEFFKAAHFLSAAVFMVVFFWHCAGTLTSWHYFVATAAIYVPAWVYPWARTIFEYGGQKAEIVVENNGFTRITIPSNAKWLPGQHCFLRFPSFGISALTSHPFTICSLPSLPTEKAQPMTFYIRHRAGFTMKLHQHASKLPGSRLPVMVDGPYGGIDNDKYFGSERLVVIAGGAGAGWILPFIEQFLRHKTQVACSKSGSALPEEDQDEHQPQPRRPRGPLSIRVVLVTRDIETRTWFLTTVNDMISASESGQVEAKVKVEVHLTGANRYIPSHWNKGEVDLENQEVSSSGETSAIGLIGQSNLCHASEDDVRGRPDLSKLIHEEAVAAEGAEHQVGVFVCGPLPMQNDVRNAVAAQNWRIATGSATGGIYLHLEHFSWA